MKDLKQIAKENEAKGFQKTWELYKKFDKAVDKILSDILGEKEEDKFGIFDLWKWIKNKYKGLQNKIDDEKDFLEEKKVKKKQI